MLMEAALNWLRSRVSRCAKADDVHRTLAAVPGVYNVESLCVEKGPGRSCRISACLRLFPESTDAAAIVHDAARKLFERYGVSEVLLGAKPYCGAAKR